MSEPSTRRRPRVWYCECTFAVVAHKENMFSDMRNYPPYHIEVRVTPVSPSMGQSRYVPPEPAYATGRNRAKYFRRPMIPYSATTHGASQVVFMKRPATQQIVEPILPPAQLTKTVGVQTLYRESEAQTDAYSPAYTLPPGSTNPEILALANLTHKAGLPAGLAEIEMIERARAKKEWETSLPNVVDEHTFNQRLRMMEEMELKEWADREKEIQQLQDSRMDILTKLLRKREAENEMAQNERIQHLWQQKIQDKEVLHNKIEAKRIKELNKLAEKRKNIEGKLIRRDIIADYANFASNVYAPKTRDGKKGGAGLSAAAAEPYGLQDYHGLAALEALFPVSVTEVDLSQPKHHNMKTPTARKEAQVIAQLEMMNQKLRDSKRSDQSNISKLTVNADKNQSCMTAARVLPLLNTRSPKFLVKVEKPAPRPSTPTIEFMSEEEAQKHQAALIIQKLIRGRIGQIVMFEGKNKGQDLIDELRMGLSIKNAAAGSSLETCLMQDRIPTPAELILTSPGLADMEKTYDVVIQGRFIGEKLDFFSKEITRLREEQKIAAVVKLANRMRRMREAAESGQRQKEIKRQEEDDALFKHVMKLHQQTVDSYLKDVLSSGLDAASSMKAHHEIQELVRKVSDVANNLGGNETTSIPEKSAGLTEKDDAVVRDLLSGFLIPEIEKRTLRNKVQQDQEKYLLAAHQSIYGAVETVEQVLGRGPEEEVPISEEIFNALRVDLDDQDSESSHDEDIIKID